MNIREYSRKPAVIGIIAGVIGIILGLIWAWGIQPVKWTDADPSYLRSDLQEDYLRMAIDSYQASGYKNTDSALLRFELLGQNASTVLEAIIANPGKQNPDAILKFVEAVQASGEVVAPTTGTTTIQTPVGTQPADGGNLTTSIVIIVLSILIVGAVALLVYRLLRPRFARTGVQSPAQQAQEISRQTERTDFTQQGEEQPIAQFVTTYVMGDDLYDESEGINSADGDFMGECGVGISEMIAVLEKPKRVSAFEVWLFDKKDIQTVTTVLMSEHAYHDEATYQRLAAKGEPVLVEPGKTIELETRALKMRVKISEAEYGQGAPPEDSYFDRMTLELAVWPKVVAPE